MKKAVGGSWFDTKTAKSWTTPLEDQTLWRTETGVWVLEKHSPPHIYGIETVDDRTVKAVLTECGADIPGDLLEDKDRI